MSEAIEHFKLGSRTELAVFLTHGATVALCVDDAAGHPVVFQQIASGRTWAEVVAHFEWHLAGETPDELREGVDRLVWNDGGQPGIIYASSPKLHRVLTDFYDRLHELATEEAVSNAKA